MKLWGLSLLMLAGCSQSNENPNDPYFRASIQSMESRIVALEEAQKQAQLEISGVRALGLENARNHDSLSKIVSGNAKVANANATRDMTSRGACGTEYVPAGNGGWVLANKRCTDRDLAPQ